MELSPLIDIADMPLGAVVASGNEVLARATKRLTDEASQPTGTPVAAFQSSV